MLHLSIALNNEIIIQLLSHFLQVSQNLPVKVVTTKIQKMSDNKKNLLKLTIYKNKIVYLYVIQLAHFHIIIPMIL